MLLNSFVYLELSVGLAGDAVGSVADQRQSAEVVLDIGGPHHGEVVLTTCTLGHPTVTPAFI